MEAPSKFQEIRLIQNHMPQKKRGLWRIVSCVFELGSHPLSFAAQALWFMKEQKPLIPLQSYFPSSPMKVYFLGCPALAVESQPTGQNPDTRFTRIWGSDRLTPKFQVFEKDFPEMITQDGGWWKVSPWVCWFYFEHQQRKFTPCIQLLLPLSMMMMKNVNVKCVSWKEAKSALIRREGGVWNGLVGSDLILGGLDFGGDIRLVPQFWYKISIANRSKDPPVMNWMTGISFRCYKAMKCSWLKPKSGLHLRQTCFAGLRFL